ALELGLVHRPRAHRRRPVLVVAVLDEERERAPERPAVAEAAARLDVVLLELLARAAAVAGLTAGEIGPDQLVVELEPRREAGDDDGEPGAVRLPCGDVRELHAAMEVTDWPVTRATSPALSHLVVMIAEESVAEAGAARRRRDRALAGATRRSADGKGGGSWGTVGSPTFRRSAEYAPARSSRRPGRAASTRRRAGARGPGRRTPSSASRRRRRRGGPGRASLRDGGKPS